MKRIIGKKPKAEKKKGKINKKLIIVAFIVIIVVAFFAIRLLPTVRGIEVDIQGLKREQSSEEKITKEQVLTLAGIKVGDKLYQEKRSVIEARIEENPYIEDAKIERDLSGKVTIQISRKKASIFD